MFLKKSTMLSWSPSYSSRPSRKRQRFIDALQAKSTQRSKPRFNAGKDHFHTSSSRRAKRELFSVTSSGNIKRTRSGRLERAWYNKDRNNPDWDRCSKVPLFQKKNAELSRVLAPAQALRCWLVSGLSKIYLIKVDFPEPAFPLTQ